jgi:membrane-bound serine protease (ClpP class)
MTTTLVIGLIVAAMVFFLLEILTPTFGIMAALGLASLGGAIWGAFTINKVFGLVMTVAAVVWVPVCLVLVVRVLPKTPLGRRLFLGRVKGGVGEGAPESARHAALVGKRGVAETPLRPTGAVRIKGRRVIASAEQGMIKEGAAVTVIRATGMNVIVREEAPA